MKNPLPAVLCVLALGSSSAFISCQAPSHADPGEELAWLTEQGVQVAPDLFATEELKFYATPTPEQLRSLVSLPHLHTLTIWDEGEGRAPTYPVGKLDDASLLLICELPGLQTLVVAGWNSFVTDHGLVHLLKLEGLKSLDLCMTARITDQGMATLARLPELEILGLTYTDITNKGMAELLAAPRLRQVDYGWTVRHGKFLEQFQRDHPEAGFLIGFQ